MSQAIAALFGAIITILFSGILLESYKRHRDLQGVASALAGEIYSIIHITEKRQTPRNFAYLLSQLEAGKQITWPDVTGGDRIEDDPVLNKQLDKIGLLPGNLPERVATFYTYLRGIRIDVRSLSKGVFVEPSAQAAIVRADLILWADANQLGNTIWLELRNIAGQPWWLAVLYRKLINSCIEKLVLIKQVFQVWLIRLKRRSLQAKEVDSATAIPPQPLTDATDINHALTTHIGDADGFNPPFQELVTDVAHVVDEVILPTLLPKFVGNKERALRYALIDFQSALLLERASRSLFGSQIDALIFLGANGGRCTRDEILNFYDAGSAREPVIYADYSFDSWLGFLENQALLKLDGATVTLTPPGKGIISYMQMRNYLSVRAAG